VCRAFVEHVCWAHYLESGVIRIAEARSRS
jgi:hypothetical protein